MARLISVITPLLNRAELLPDAMASLAAQHPTRFEHIVVDGGSTDGSQAIAAASGATVIPAPRTSIYEAINIGLERAAGDIICLLNSDDRLADGALVAAQSIFEKDPGIDLVCGRARIERPDGKHFQSDAAVALRAMLLGPSNINACFFKADLLRRVGLFDTTQLISADRLWLARVLISDARTHCLDQVTYVYRDHADSLTIGGGKAATIQWVREHITWSREMLRGSQLSKSDRAALLAFHAKETVHLIMLYLKRRDSTAAARVLSSSLGFDPIWPLSAVEPLSRIVLRRILQRDSPDPPRFPHP